VVARRFDTDPNVTPFLRALDTLRREASRQGEFPEHVATIIAMIDQYAESAMRNRHYFSEATTGSACTDSSRGFGGSSSKS
jgi:hypothetical protein